MAQHGAKASVLSILDLAQPVAVLDDGFPARERSDPRPNVIVNADVVAEHVATPAVMVARYPEDWDVGLHEVGERGENSERRSRDDGSPLEPELEQVAVDDERPRAAAQMAQE